MKAVMDEREPIAPVTKGAMEGRSSPSTVELVRRVMVATMRPMINAPMHDDDHELEEQRGEADEDAETTMRSAAESRGTASAYCFSGSAEGSRGEKSRGR